jgi:hypothetical protein
LPADFRVIPILHAATTPGPLTEKPLRVYTPNPSPKLGAGL